MSGGGKYRRDRILLYVPKGADLRRDTSTGPNVIDDVHVDPYGAESGGEEGEGEGR